MTVILDPKKAGAITRPEPTPEAATVKRPRRAAAELASMEKPAGLAAPKPAATHPQVQPHSGHPAPTLNAKLAAVRAALAGGEPARRAAATQSLHLAASYVMRRSGSLRRRAASLCDEVSEYAPELGELAVRLRSVLTAEGALHELDPDSSAAACAELAVAVDDQSGSGEEPHRAVAALAHATLAHGLVQLVVHFPAQLAEAQVPKASALEHALVLAEQAIALAPTLADGHAALGRVLLCSDDAEALGDSEALFTHALTLDAEHDPALAGLAAAQTSRGEPEQALATAERLLARGNTVPHAYLLRAVAEGELGRFDAAMRDLERAMRLAPRAGLLHLEAARVARRAHDEAAAQAFAARANELLGSDYAAQVLALLAAHRQA